MAGAIAELLARLDPADRGSAFGRGLLAPASALLPEARDPERWAALRGDRAMAPRIAELFAAADEARLGPIPVLGFGSFMRFYRDGDRSEYEAAYFGRRGRLQLCALALLAGGGDEYAWDLDDSLWAVCDEYSWCLPAHLKAPSAASSADERADDPRRCVDLFAAETALCLAEISVLLADRISPEAALRAKREALDRVVLQFAEDGPRYDWERAQHNWAAVCAGGAAGAALWLLDDEPKLRALLGRLGPAFDSYLEGFPADGACLEGLGYWSYGFGHFLAFSELLRERTGGELELFAIPSLREKLRAIALFPAAARLGGEIGLSFSDAQRPYRFPLGFMCRLARKFEGLEIPPIELAEELSYDPCHRWAKSLRDFAWYEAGPVKAEERGPRIHYFPEAQQLLVSAERASPPFGLAIKGGNNGEPHNHDDVGSFMLALGGQPFLEDLGAPRYDRDYFREATRYAYLAASSRGHSLPILDGSLQSPGPGFRCLEALFSERQDGFSASFEIAGAYEEPRLLSLRRSIEGQFRGAHTLVLLDDYRFGAAPTDTSPFELRERFVSLLPATIGTEGLVRIKGSALTLELAPSPRPDRIEIGGEDFLPHEGPATRASFIDFVYLLYPTNTQFRFELRFRPAAHR